MDTTLLEPRHDLAPRDVEQWPDHAVVAHGMNAAEGGRARTGHEPHEQRLGLIVLLVCRGDVVGTGVAPDLLQACESSLPCRRLNAAAAQGARFECPIGNMQRDVERCAEVADERLIALRLLAAEVMIHMPGDELEVVPQLRHRQQHRRRVEPPRHRRHNAFGRDLVRSEELADGVGEHDGLGSPLSVGGGRAGAKGNIEAKGVVTCRVSKTRPHAEARSRVQNHRPCHPEREGGGSGGREGSPHKSWCRSTSSAAILRSLPDPHPSLRMTGNLDLSGATIVSSLRFGARAVNWLRMTGTWTGPA